MSTASMPVGRVGISATLRRSVMGDTAEERLENAIAALNSANERLCKIETAIDETSRETWEAQRLRRELQTRLNAAKEAESHVVVSALIGEGTEDKQTSVAEFESALAEITKEHNELRHREQLLSTEALVAESGGAPVCNSD